MPGPPARTQDGAKLSVEKTLIEYFLPMPIRGRLTSDVWAPRVSSLAIRRTAWYTVQGPSIYPGIAGSEEAQGRAIG